MNQPFFSIILPTKNRPELLRDAMRSVLLQDFSDYELVVSDNFNDIRTKNTIDEFQDDPHLVRLRTDRELCIPEHWEFAAAHTKGAYTMLLTDRAFLRQGALKDIHDSIIEAKNPQVAFWKYGYFDEKKGVLQNETEEEGAQILKSAELIKNFTTTLDAHFLPRPHLGCYARPLIEAIRRDAGHLYLPYGPDYTSSLLALTYSDTVLFIPRPLVFFQGASFSAGTKAQTDIRAYLASLNMPDPYAYLPVKAPINTSMIFGDIAKVKALAKVNQERIILDWVFYFSVCYQTLMEMGLIWGVEKGTVKEFWQEWERALREHDAAFQKAVKQAARRRWGNIAKSYARTTFTGRFLLWLKRVFAGKPTRRYADAFVAGGFDLSTQKST